MARFVRFLVITFVTINSFCYGSDEIFFMTHYLKPFSSMEGDVIEGYAVDVVREMMKNMNHSGKIHFRPFKRGLLEVQTTKNHAFFVVARRAEREKTVKWVGPITIDGVYFYKRKSDTRKYCCLNDMQYVGAIGVGRGNADHFYLKDKHFKNIYATNNQKQSLELLMKGRIDVTPISEFVAPAMAADANIDFDLIERTGVKLYDSELYLVFSKDISDDVVAKWQKSLDALKKNGIFESISKEYNH